MAFDGTLVAALTKEFSSSITDCRINKIAQPEDSEILLTIKGSCGQKRLLISVNPALPFACFTEKNKPSPLTAPNFCMVLRKHLSNGRILSVTQPSLERIIVFEIEHRDEMGDLCVKKLILELMGKYSNLIFTDNDNNIIDALRRVSSLKSSLREVLPGRKYVFPEELSKLNPLTTTRDEFEANVLKKPNSIAKALVAAYSGMSMVVANELAFQAHVDGGSATASIDDNAKVLLTDSFFKWQSHILSGDFVPVSYHDDNGKPLEYAAVPLSMYGDKTCVTYESISALLEEFFKEKNIATNIKQKSTDLRKIVSSAIEKDAKKLDLLTKQLKDTEKKDKWKIYGELLLTYQYQIAPGSEYYECENYYTGEMVRITLDPEKTALENANALFEKYNKQKRTASATEDLLRSTEAELAHLKSIEQSLSTAKTEEDLFQIKDELIAAGFIRKQTKGKNSKPAKAKPLHFISSDGIDMYVGKNNFQNEEVTFKMAQGSDWWFHAKKMPGSHVIVKTGNAELPDATCEEAARLAAYYSSGKENGKVEVDYVQKKEIKKPQGSPLGFVVYYTNYSMIANADIKGINEADS